MAWLQFQPGPSFRPSFIRTISTILRLNSTPTPREGARAFNRSPVLLPIFNTVQPGGTWNRQRFSMDP